jgi:hypothetical protein
MLLNLVCIMLMPSVTGQKPHTQPHKEFKNMDSFPCTLASTKIKLVTVLTQDGDNIEETPAGAVQLRLHACQTP